MKQFTFPLGKKGHLTFLLEDTLVMTAAVAEEVYTLRFTDAVNLDNTIPGRCSTARTVSVFTPETRLVQEENTLLTASEVDPGVWVRNRFTVRPDKAAVEMETWVEAEHPVYDASLLAGRTKMDPTGFTEIGGDAPLFFPINPSPPHYGFKGHMILRGQNRYLQVEGGFLWQDQGMIDAHFQSGNFNSDITWFSGQNPLRTRYAFEEIQPQPPCNYNAAVTEPTGAVVSGALIVPYALTESGAVFLQDGEPYAMAAMLVKELATGLRRYVDTGKGWNAVTVTEKPGGTEFLFKNHREIPGIGLRLFGKICPNSRIEWTTEAINPSATHTLIWCSYPQLRHNAHRVLDLFHPYGGGDVEVGFNRTDGYKASAYPAGLLWSMPYVSAYPTGSREENGIYYAIHDPKGSYKNLAVTANSQGVLQFTCKYCAENLGEPGNGFVLPGAAVWQVFRGDWFDATELYRVFAETCPWMPADNSRIPAWMRELPFWIMDWMPNESDAEEPIPISLRPNTQAYGPDCWFEIPLKLRQELGVPFGYHLYNWHGIPFNNDYPHYFPTKKALSRGLAKLQAAGIRIMPYINALLWDNRDRGNEDFQFTALAKPGTVKKESGQPAILTYASHESDGEKVRLSPMCPTSRVWWDKVKENVMQLFALGMDGVYLDQTAAHGPHPCMDKSHPHAPGGGSWWSENQRAMLAELNASKPKDKIFTSEGTAEVYAGALDGLLSWAWVVVDKYVPAFMRVYGGRVMVFGRNANGYMKDTQLYWKYHLAQSLVAGEQMGWINSDFVYNQERLDFARKLIRFRYENRAFFQAARPMRPPEVEAPEAHKFATGIGMQWQGVLHEPYLTVGALENGKQNMLVAVNLHTEEISDTLWFKGSELGLKADNFTVTCEGAAEFLDENHLRLTLPGESLLCLSWEV